MTVFAVEYVYAENSDELRNEHRPAHRAYLGGFLQDGGSVQVLASGPCPITDGALLIFSAETEQALREVLDGDPFNKVGALDKTVVTEWNPVTGLLSAFAS
ncbi:YciI family protein [Glutamicibacter sp. MNS18]|uniref:YciI family protein n=1 Tax=Glutamicibacter sp. MNS18 TaxID=2989817 RepID=UPI00223669FB|nr:YciI family protein [Glutamicibacter sp. MNS18]MCW4465243.1 YciI family protein [Glutamicibacter sp. MNS18]